MAKLTQDEHGRGQYYARVLPQHKQLLDFVCMGKSTTEVQSGGSPVARRAFDTWGSGLRILGLNIDFPIIGQQYV